MNKPVDTIELYLPFKAEYVSVVRLTVSGIANRIGFDIDIIEDIKVAVAEVCNKLVMAGSTTADTYKITFKISDKRLDIVFDCEDKSLQGVFNEVENELGISIISALMDEIEFCSQGSYLLSMSKVLEGDI